MSSPREELKQYCLRKLGHPVVEVNVTDSQLDDAVEDTIDLFNESHNEGSINQFVKHTITQVDIDNKYVTLPDHVQAVVRVMPLNDTNINSGNLFNPVYHYHLSEVWDWSNSSMYSYELSMENVNLIQSMFAQTPNQAFNQHRSRLELATDWSKFIPDSSILIMEVYSAVDPEEFYKCYNDRWVKRYCTAMVKRQWGTNLKKFQGVILPSGITLDGKTIYDEAIEEIALLEEELHTRYELPVDFFVG